MASTSVPKELSPEMANFLKAMQHVYRFPVPSLDGTLPTSWTPPPAAAGHKGRYLWTDAFGVINFLTLFRETCNPHYLTLAKSLVNTVHSILGYTRDGRARLPNATDDAPLSGGLRIGKDSESGPDSDGQYHHYLTLWMFALNRLSLASGEKRYNDLGIQLARAIHPHFVYNRSSSRPRMVWKMSMDLSHPLVRSEGNLDPIDGLVTFKLLQRADGENSRALEGEIHDYEKIVQTKWQGYSSEDPLDLGMTLWTSHWFGTDSSSVKKEQWSESLLNAAKRDTKELFDERYFDVSPRRRLAFREFGTCLGIRTALVSGKGTEEWTARANKIVHTWEKTKLVPNPDEEDGAAASNAMTDLQPISLVMYAAAQNPGAFKKGYLVDE